MLSSAVTTSFLSLLLIPALTTAQALSSADYFVLYPLITSGSISPGPYTAEGINKDQPLRPASGRGSATTTSDCFNRMLFTSYVGSHCYGEEMCGQSRWTVNATNPDPDCNTLVTLQSYYEEMLIAGLDDVDSLGRRDVGWTACQETVGTPGLSIAPEADDGTVAHLRYDNPADIPDAFGTFMACYTTGEYYGPRLYYRNAEEKTPEGCAELLLTPRCSKDYANVKAPVKSQCYQGGLP